jgi:hypothetical protein
MMGQDMGGQFGRNHDNPQKEKKVYEMDYLRAVFEHSASLLTGEKKSVSIALDFYHTFMTFSVILYELLFIFPIGAQRKRPLRNERPFLGFFKTRLLLFQG